MLLSAFQGLVLPVLELYVIGTIWYELFFFLINLFIY